MHKLLVAIRANTIQQRSSDPLATKADGSQALAKRVHRSVDLVPTKETFTVQKGNWYLVCVYTCDDETSKRLCPLLPGSAAFISIDHQLKHDSGAQALGYIGHLVRRI